MNYILQLNGFWNWTRTNEISHLEVDLYLSILDIANTSSWKTQFTIPNSTLGRFDKNSLTRARNKLVQYGLIKFYKGKKGQAPTYSIVKLYGKEIDPISDTNNDTNSDDKFVINPNNDTYIDTNSDTNNDTNVIPIQGTYINKKENKTKLKENISPVIPFDEPLKTKVDEWLAYKKERGNKYKPIGLKGLFQTIQKALDEYGVSVVIAGIDKSISSNWQGLFFDKVANQKTSVGDDSGLYTDDYDHDFLEQLTRDKYNR